VIHQKQVIADSSGQAATVWDLSGQPAKDSGKEYSRLFKEIMGALK
jgi:chromosome partitioning protein